MVLSNSHTNKNLIKQRQSGGTATSTTASTATPTIKIVGEQSNANLLETGELPPPTKRSNMSSKNTDYSKPSKSVNFRPSSLINEREYANENQTYDLRKVRANYSYDPSQANRIPVLKPNSQSSYYAQAIGKRLFFSLLV